MEQKFRRRVEALDEIFEFIGGFAREHNIDESVSFALNLVVEELFTNFVKHHPENPNEILIRLVRDGSRLIVNLIDYDAQPFDPTLAGEVNVQESLPNRKVGGLGIHLVKKMVDELHYEYVHGESRITVIKNLEK